jgi:hypothetical protein
VVSQGERIVGEAESVNGDFRSDRRWVVGEWFSGYIAQILRMRQIALSTTDVTPGQIAPAPDGKIDRDKFSVFDPSAGDRY